MARADISRLTRLPERSVAGRAALDDLLDEALVGTLSVALDGQLWSVPMLFARDGDRLLIHGSSAAGTLAQAVRGGAQASFTVFVLDAVVVAYSAFESSANYRSAVLRGQLAQVPAGEQNAALAVLTDRLVPGRTGEVPPNSRKELAATAVLQLPLRDGCWVLKARTGPADPPDEPTTAWSGVLPVHTVAGEPQADDWVDPRASVPSSVQALRARWPAVQPGGDVPVLAAGVADRLMALTLHRGPGWLPDRERRSQPGWREHAAFMDDLASTGVVVLGGPVGDGTDVMLAMSAASREEIEALLAADPWLDRELPILQLGETMPWQIWLRAAAG